MLTLLLSSWSEDKLQQIEDILEVRPRPLNVFNWFRDCLVVSHSMNDIQQLELLIDLVALGGQKL